MLYKLYWIQTRQARTRKIYCFAMDYFIRSYFHSHVLITTSDDSVKNIPWKILLTFFQLKMATILVDVIYLLPSFSLILYILGRVFVSSVTGLQIKTKHSFSRVIKMASIVFMIPPHMTLEGKTSTVQFIVSSFSNYWGRAFILSSYNVTFSPFWFCKSLYYWLAFANLANPSTACEDSVNSKLLSCRL